MSVLPQAASLRVEDQGRSARAMARHLVSMNRFDRRSIEAVLSALLPGDTISSMIAWRSYSTGSEWSTWETPVTTINQIPVDEADDELETAGLEIIKARYGIDHFDDEIPTLLAMVEYALLNAGSIEAKVLHLDA